MVGSASYRVCLVGSESTKAWAVHGTTVRRISPFCCRMPTYQPCRKTLSQKLEEFLEEDFMVSFLHGIPVTVQKIIGLFMIRCHGILYSRVSKGPPLHGGKCKCFQNFVCNFVSSYFLSLCGIVQCGRVVVQNTCNVCGATIGGTNYNLAHDNRDART